MSLILEGLQFVKETTTSEGDLTPGSPTPSLTLLGPPDGYESIITKIGNGNEGFFFLRHGFAWMRFRGTVTNPDQLSVDDVLASSDAGNPLVLGPGTKQVYCALDEHSIPGGMVLLGSAVAAGSAVIDFTSLITANFSEYELRCEQVIPQANAAQLWVRISVNNGNTYETGNTYAYARHAVGSNGADSGAGSNADGKLVLFTLADTVGVTGVIRFSVLTNQFTFHVFGLGSDGTYYSMTGGGISLTAAINAIRIMMSTGTITSGVFRLYGVRK